MKVADEIDFFWGLQLYQSFFSSIAAARLARRIEKGDLSKRGLIER